MNECCEQYGETDEISECEDCNTVICPACTYICTNCQKLFCYKCANDIEYECNECWSEIIKKSDFEVDFRV